MGYARRASTGRSNHAAPRRHRQLLQRAQGLRIHHRFRGPGRVRALCGNPARGLPDARARGAGALRHGRGRAGLAGGECGAQAGVGGR